MKKIFLLLAVCLGIVTADAQITTGENTSQVIRNGNRAKAGNFGIYFGATTDMFRDLFDNGKDDVNISGLPLINVKYMKSDKLEYRLGIEWYKKSTTTSPSEGDDSKEFEKKFMFYPGVAYHFSNKNLLDVYAGGEIPFGWGNSGSEYGGEDYTISNFRVGLGAFIGLQAYIANLPLAIGVEYGISTAYNAVSNGTVSKDGLSIDYENGEYTKDVDQKRFVLGNQVRFTLSYYFDL